MSWFRWGGEGFGLDKTSDVVMKGKGDGVPQN